MRTWLKTTLELPSIQMIITEPELPLTGMPVFQGEAMHDSLVSKPFIVFTVGNSTNEQFSESNSTPERQFFQIYVHDEPADYSRIDQVVKAIKETLVGLSSPADDILTVRHLETSRDLDDNTLKTIMRYIRFQAIRGEAR